MCVRLLGALHASASNHRLSQRDDIILNDAEVRKLSALRKEQMAKREADANSNLVVVGRGTQEEGHAQQLLLFAPHAAFN